MNTVAKYKDDLHLVQLYLDKDVQVERLFYKEVKRLIRNMIHAMAKRGSVFYDQENVVSEIVFEIMLKDNSKILRAYQGKSRLSTYLWPIIRFRLIDFIRREHRYFATFTRVQNKKAYQENSNPSQQIAEIIHDHIRKESPENRFIKTAKWIEGMQYSEIIAKAEKLGLAIKETHQIAYVLRCNRKTLEKKLKKFGY